MSTIEIVIASPDHGYTWDAWMGDEHLGRFKEPLFDACRVLLARGVDPSTKVATRHAGQPYRSLTTTVSYAAGRMVENDHVVRYHRPKPKLGYNVDRDPGSGTMSPESQRNELAGLVRVSAGPSSADQ